MKALTRRTYATALGLSAFFAAGQASVSPGSAPIPREKALVPFTAYRLPNGLRLVLAPDHTAPVIGLCVAYAVGSADERPGQAGLAHLCEHLMSQGSAHVGRNEHALLVDELGGHENAETTADETEYFETLPANQLDLGLFLEADRMASLEITPSAVRIQKAVVQDEKRERVDDQEYADLRPTLLRLAYTRFGYGHSGYGARADLKAVTPAAARAFHDAYYAPNNAVLALAGDFDPDAARRLIARRFGPIPQRAVAPRADTREPSALAFGNATLKDHFNSRPRYEVAYRVPPETDPDDAPLTLLANVLGKGRSSRLGTALVEPERAMHAYAWLWDRRGPGLFVVAATLPPYAQTAPVAGTVDAVLARIETQGVTAAELAKAKSWERSRTVYGLYRAEDRARQLAGFSVETGEVGLINRQLPLLDAVSAADVQRVARRYLRPGHRVVVTVLPYDDPRAPLL